jgi:hypothetical protein
MVPFSSCFGDEPSAGSSPFSVDESTSRIEPWGVRMAKIHY